MYPVLFLVPAGCAAVFSVLHLFFLRKWNRIFKNIALEHNLDYRKGNLFRPFQLIGENENSRMYICLDSLFKGEFLKKNTLSFSSEFKNETIKGFSAVMETTFSRLQKKISGNDLKIMDPEFDDLVYLKASSELTAFAYLNFEARQLIIDLIKDSYRQSFSIYDGELRAVFGVEYENGYDDVERQLNRIYRLGELFSRKPAVTDTEKKKINREKNEEYLLRENYKTEPYIPSKIKQLSLIGSRNKRIRSDDEIVCDALESDHVRLKFTGVCVLGKKGYKYIPEIFSPASDKLKNEILEYILKENTDYFFSYFLTAAPYLGTETKQLVYRYFEMTADPAAEDFLISELEKNSFRSGAAEKDCIAALGSCGTIKAITALDKHGHSRQADQAIAKIQERVGVGDSGWLSLKKPKDEDGRLSMEDKK